MFIARCDVSDFKKLLVWQKGHALALHAHRVATGIRRRQNVPLSISETDFSQLLREVVEVRKMIHGLLKKIGDRIHDQEQSSAPNRTEAAG